MVQVQRKERDRNVRERDNTTFLEMESEVCKTLASPKRIEILDALKEGEKTVSELARLLGVGKANVSQHLALMRHKGILKWTRKGLNVYYRVSNPKIIAACTLMKEVLLEQVEQKVR
jgi:ArsR family transcriptional regulator